MRVAQSIPTTGTNKVVKRTLAHQHVRRDRIGTDVVYVRDRGDQCYRPVIDIEQDGIVAVFSDLPDDFRDITEVDAHARIIHQQAVHLFKKLPIPLHHHGQQLGDIDNGIRRAKL